MNNFEHRVLRIKPINLILLCKDVLVGVLNLHRDKNRRREPGRDVKILTDRMLHIKGSAEHSRCLCADRPPRSADKQLHNNVPQRKCLRK